MSTILVSAYAPTRLLSYFSSLPPTLAYVGYETETEQQAPLNYVVHSHVVYVGLITATTFHYTLLFI